MQKGNRTLYLFTAEFPYGNKSETFLETEILYLSKGFKKVVIFPSVDKGNGKRSLPNNVTVDNSIIEGDFGKKNKVKNLIANFFIVWSVLLSEIKDKGFKKVMNNRKNLLDYLSQQLVVKSILTAKALKKNIVYYDYWFINSLLALTFLKKKSSMHSLVCRAHGFDLYDERNGDVGIPFRIWKMKSIDKLFLISQDGLDYVKSKIKNKYHHKLELSRLGVEKGNLNNSIIRKEKEEKLLVSCSSMLNFKQVDKIPLLLKELSCPIKWVHFGDGPDRDKVELAIKSLPKNISYELKGHVDNCDVIEFYRSQQPDLFISLSLSEGLPVSMMEAQSYGVPILSYPVGGIPELVINGKTGQLLEMNMDLKYAVKMFSKTINHNFDKKEIIEFFNLNFNASVNYANFTNLINA